MAMSSGVVKSIFDWLVAEFCAKHFAVKLWSYGLQNKILQHLVGAKSAIESGRKPTKLQLFYSELYDVLTVDGITRVIVKKVRQDGSVRVMLPKEEFFDVINSYHEKMGHVGPAKLSFAVRQRYVVPKLIISLFARTCTVCCDVQHVTDKNDSEINCSTGYARKNSEILPSKDQGQVLHLSQSSENRDGASCNNSKIKTPQGSTSSKVIRVALPGVTHRSQLVQQVVELIHFPDWSNYGNETETTFKPFYCLETLYRPWWIKSTMCSL